MIRFGDGKGKNSPVWSHFFPDIDFLVAKNRPTVYIQAHHIQCHFVVER
jgi:hypothetical protein